MPLRKYQIAKKAIDKTKLDDDAQVRIQTQLLLARGAGAAIIGNSGTSYAELACSANLFRAGDFKNITVSRWYIGWHSKTTAGGVRIRNVTTGAIIASIEPGVAEGRIETIDISDKIKPLTGDNYLVMDTKGDGTTAPEVSFSYIEVVISTAI